MRRVFIIIFLLSHGAISAQKLMLSFPHNGILKGLPGTSTEESLKKEFYDKNLSWPVRQMYIRSFKYDSQLEVWVRNTTTESFRLFKTYRICTLSGSLGPKRYENDYQVPEGFYHISEFRPRSEFHMALGISYPNASDGLLSDSVRPGGGIFIHGSCVTTGCIPIRDEPMEELYLLASQAKQQGQDFIPVHIFPIRYNAPKSELFMAKNSRDNFEYQRFSSKLRQAFDYFELHKKLPLIGVNAKGEYVFF
jgi:murein L,D-transpeptidase YafK